jgi:hypothetical protein
MDEEVFDYDIYDDWAYWMEESNHDSLMQESAYFEGPRDQNANLFNQKFQPNLKHQN